MNEPTEEDDRWVEECLGRRPRSEYGIAVRDDAGRAAVIANPPFLDDGTPMPTRYWLICPTLNRIVGTLESEGGVQRSERQVDATALEMSHARYAVEREALISADREGPRPSGGVGGTRVGVKCLHTHLAWYLAGGDDPIGEWVLEELCDPGDDDHTAASTWLESQAWIRRPGQRGRR